MIEDFSRRPEGRQTKIISLVESINTEGLIYAGNGFGLQLAGMDKVLFPVYLLHVLFFVFQ